MMEQNTDHTDIFKFKNSSEIFNLHSGKVPYLSFKCLDEKGVINAFSTRKGGVSEGCFAEMNLSFTGGDDREKVMENYRRLSSAVGVDINRMVSSKQTHSTNVRRVTEEDFGKGIIRDRDYDCVDGLITDVKGLTLVTFYADCIPLYFYSEKRSCIGLSHSGWRGTVERMGEVTVKRLFEEFGVEPEELICCIGPGICGDCFETDAETARIFCKAFPEASLSELISFISKENSESDIRENDISELKKQGIVSASDITDGRKYYIDLWYANRLVLLSAGVRPENIYVTNLCTRCNNKLLFSHRICGNRRGNMAAMLCMKEE